MYRRNYTRVAGNTHVFSYYKDRKTEMLIIIYNRVITLYGINTECRKITVTFLSRNFLIHFFCMLNENLING